MMNTLRSTARSLSLSLVVAGLLAGAACNKDGDKKPADAPVAQPGPGRPAPGPPQPGPPPAGTDADRKKIAAQELATAIDAALATYTKAEQEIPPGASGRGRKAEAWSMPGTDGRPATPKKVVIAEVDDKGAVLETTDFYFNDMGRLTLARAPDGLFVFENELLAVWLDREQRVKRGVSPGAITQRVEVLKKDMVAGLGAFNLR